MRCLLAVLWFMLARALSRCLEATLYLAVHDPTHMLEYASICMPSGRDALTIGLYLASGLLFYYIWEDTRALTRCLDKWPIPRSSRLLSHAQVLDHACMLELCSVSDRSPRFDCFGRICSEMLSLKCLANVFHIEGLARSCPYWWRPLL